MEIGEWMIVQLINTLTDTANARAPVGGVTRQGLVEDRAMQGNMVKSCMPYTAPYLSRILKLDNLR